MLSGIFCAETRLLVDGDNNAGTDSAAALTDGEIVNYNNIASDCGVAASTVREYFAILEDTLVGYMVPAYAKVKKRKLVQAPRFYYFDVGVANHLLHRQYLVRGTAEYGHAFEHLVVQEIVAYLGYMHSEKHLSYWRTYAGAEVDAVIGSEVAIEIKSVEEVLPRHLKGLKAFGEEHPEYQWEKEIATLKTENEKISEERDALNEQWEKYVLDFGDDEEIANLGDLDTIYEQMVNEIDAENKKREEESKQQGKDNFTKANEYDTSVNRILAGNAQQIVLTYFNQSNEYYKNAMFEDSMPLEDMFKAFRKFMGYNDYRDYFNEVNQI